VRPLQAENLSLERLDSHIPRLDGGLDPTGNQDLERVDGRPPRRAAIVGGVLARRCVENPYKTEGMHLSARPGARRPLPNSPAIYTIAFEPIFANWC
jgi:hypothetical protein